MHIMIGARHSEINSLAKEHNTLRPATTLPLYLFENKTTTATTKNWKKYNGPQNIKELFYETLLLISLYTLISVCIFSILCSKGFL